MAHGLKDKVGSEKAGVAVYTAFMQMMRKTPESALS